jgi:hypothetical protein
MVTKVVLFMFGALTLVCMVSSKDPEVKTYMGLSSQIWLVGFLVKHE